MGSHCTVRCVLMVGLYGRVKITEERVLEY